MWPSLWQTMIPGIGGEVPTPAPATGSGNSGQSQPAPQTTKPLTFWDWVYDLIPGASGVASVFGAVPGNPASTGPAASVLGSLDPTTPQGRQELQKFMIGLLLYGVMLIALANFVRPGTSSDVVAIGKKAGEALAS